MNGLNDIASALRERLLAPLESDPDFWTFAADSRRTMGHAFFNYPAMMVPQVQGALLDLWIASDPHHRLILDPFAGSGTVMTEAMMRGLDFRGVDINPLAILLLKVKARPLAGPTLANALTKVLAAVDGDKRTSKLDFRGREKWFNDSVAVQLTRLHRGIAALPGRDVRRFFWVCLAATVRRVSNSRTSTFKLHTYSTDVLDSRVIDTLKEFKEVATENIAHAVAQRQALIDSELLTSSGHYKGLISHQLVDVRSIKSRTATPGADLLMTSPPYGDNRTTVPYGQYAFLPLKWIDPADLDGGDRLVDLIENPYRTDVASLGGRPGAEMVDQLVELGERSDSVREVSKLLKDVPGDGLRRFGAFVCDLDEAMRKINTQLRPGAFQFWTLGERSIASHRIPTTRIVAELATAQGCTEVVTLTRSIPNGRKRMAIRNDSGSTIRSETILVMQSSSTGADLPETTPTPNRLAL